MNVQVSELLRKTRVEVLPETYFVVSLTEEEFNKLLQHPHHSPRMKAPFMIFKDNWETTLVLDETDFNTCRPALDQAKIEGNFRLLSFDIELDFKVVGFLAEISRILAEAQISILAFSSFSRDHLLIKQNDLGKALIILGQYVEELC